MNTEKETLERNMRMWGTALIHKAVEFVTNKHRMLKLELEKHSQGLTNTSLAACVSYIYRHKTLRFLEWAMVEYAASTNITI